MGDLFRADAIDRRTEIIDYLKNVFYFLDRCPDLAVEEVCGILRRVKLEGDQIAIVPCAIDCDLHEHIGRQSRQAAKQPG